jgi:hypothetical protein
MMTYSSGVVLFVAIGLPMLNCKRKTLKVETDWAKNSLVFGGPSRQVRTVTGF